MEFHDFRATLRQGFDVFPKKMDPDRRRGYQKDSFQGLNATEASLWMIIPSESLKVKK